MLVTLTTDFGSRDAFVGAMKGVLLSINPSLQVVDLCHEVEPRNIRQGAFLLYTAYPYFPPDTIHIGVVDPGVGTERKLVLLLTQRGRFLAPDNGLLSYVLSQAPWYEAYSLTNPSYWLMPLSATFHGRDILAPVAAHLSLGVPPQELGERLSHLVTFPIPLPKRGERGELEGEVVHIDIFGNLITSLRGEDLPPGDIRVEIAGRTIKGLSPSYATGGPLLALVGSSGHLEVAARNKSAARLLRVKIGEAVRAFKP